MTGKAQSYRKMRALIYNSAQKTPEILIRKDKKGLKTKLSKKEKKVLDAHGKWETFLA